MLVAAGYSISQSSLGIELGWAAAWAAVLTAYVRYLGNAITSQQCFSGPMAKQHRMAILTIALISACLESQLTGQFDKSLTTALALILIGSLVTVIRRLCLVTRSAHQK